MGLAEQDEGVKARQGGGVVALAALVLTAATVVQSTSSTLTPSIDAASATSFSPRILARVPSTSIIYLVTQDECAEQLCLGMWRTSNGGVSFERRSAPPATKLVGALAGSLDRVVFATPSDGFAVVGNGTFTLYATTNGARSWHRITSMPGKNWSGLTVTAHSLLVTTDRCTKRNVVCSDYRVWRSSLRGSHWTQLPVLWRTGSGPKDVYYGPSVAAFGDTVWELETAYMAVYLWTSHNDGRTFSRALEQKLGSVAGCELLPMSASDLWAQCPTGMDVSFLDSSDGGRIWRSITQHQFSGTGGGAFDPVSSSLAYLDYGLSYGPPNLFRVSNGGVSETAVGRLSDDSSLVFTNERDGLAICDQNDSDFLLARTTDGGVRWSSEALYGN